MAARQETSARQPRMWLAEELVLGEMVCGPRWTHFAQKNRGCDAVFLRRGGQPVGGGDRVAKVEK
jgi:hypothetical protein